MTTLVPGPVALTLGANAESVAQFLTRILRDITPLRPLDLALLDAGGSVLADPLYATTPIPGYDAASFDGYAISTTAIRDASPRHPVSLPVIGDIMVGCWQPQRLPPHSAFCIAKGAPVPAGCDAVISKDATDGGVVSVTVYQSARPEYGILRAGAVATSGQRLAAVGEEVNPALLGVLAGAGYHHVPARPRPRVICAAVGAEYVEPGTANGVSQTNDAATFVVAAGAREAGAQAFRISALGDDPERITATLTDAAMRADLLILTGDARLISELFDDVTILSFALEPEGDIAFGRIGGDGTPTLCVPGEPGTAHIWWELALRPMVRRLIGHQNVFRYSMKATLAEAVTSPEGVREFRPGHVSERRGGGYSVRALPHRERLASGLARANALMVLSDQVGTVPAGASVDVMMLDRDCG